MGNIWTYDCDLYSTGMGMKGREAAQACVCKGITGDEETAADTPDPKDTKHVERQGNRENALFVRDANCVGPCGTGLYPPVPKKTCFQCTVKEKALTSDICP